MIGGGKMQKPNALRTASLIALILCGAKLLLDIILIMVPEISLSLLSSPAFLRDAESPMIIRIILILSAVISAAPLGALAAAGFTQSGMKHSRGVLMLVLAGVFYIISLVSDLLLDQLALILSGRLYNAEVLSVVATQNSALRMTGVLLTAAFAMMCCCAAVEAYGGARESAPFTDNNNGGNFQ